MIRSGSSVGTAKWALDACAGKSSPPAPPKAKKGKWVWKPWPPGRIEKKDLEDESWGPWRTGGGKWSNYGHDSWDDSGSYGGTYSVKRIPTDKGKIPDKSWVDDSDWQNQYGSNFEDNNKEWTERTEWTDNGADEEEDKGEPEMDEQELAEWREGWDDKWCDPPPKPSSAP